MGGDELGQDLRDCGSVVVCDDGGVGGHVKNSEVVSKGKKKGSKKRGKLVESESLIKRQWEKPALEVLKIQADLRIQHDASLFCKSRPARDVGFHIGAKCFRRHRKQVDRFGR